jgi:hypothetical protein
MGGLPTIGRGVGYGPLATISRGYLTDGTIPEPDPDQLGGWFRRIVLSLQIRL